MPNRLLTIALAALACLIAAPTSAFAERASGTSRVSLDGKGFDALRSQGVRLSATRPVRVSRDTLVLPVSAGTVGKTVRLDGKGRLTLRKGRRSFVVKGLRATLARRGSITGVVGKRRLTLFSVVPARRKAMRVNLATGRVTLQSARVSIPRSAGRAIRKALRLRRTPAGSLGTVTVIVTVARGKGGGSKGGLPSGSVPAAGPLPGAEPPELARPATAVDVTPTSYEWNVRDSFIDYVNTQPAPNGGSYPTAGATAGAAEDRGSGPLVYRFAYTPVRGWWDAASGRAALYFTGSVNFRYYGHGIDFDAKNPEIEINGGASRAIYRLDGRRSTPYGNRRGVLLDLESGTTAGPRCAAAGKVVTCANVPARVPADAGQSVFAGFYQQGDAFGSITVSFTTP